MERWLPWILALVLTKASVTSGCPGDRPLKQLICRQNGPLHDKFDPCLCTHLVLEKDIQDISSGEAKKAVIDYKAVNPSLQVLGSWSPDSQSDLDGSQLAKKADSLELDGIFFQSSTDASGPSAKEKILNLVKVLASELDNLRSSKRADEKYQHNHSSSDRSQDTGIIVQLPSQPQALGKHYDLKKLSKYVDYYVMTTDNITDVSENGFTYHPSRLMGIDDVLNADSLIDLISGLGAPQDRLILSLPSSAFTFTLVNPDQNMPRSKVTGPPKKISQSKLCELMEEGGWTMERDEDLTAPYAYKNSSWMAFDDIASAAIKGKYILLRDLAGAAMDSIEMEDWAGDCTKETHGNLIKSLYETFTSIARKPRAAQLLALQEQIHDAYNIPFSDVALSPYRIVRVVDRAGSIHVVRKEAKTEFTCSRQGYFTHPSGCNRFYRCVKFNQYSSDFTVFEYDCPAGLAFDERYEVCVWPGSLPDANACKGSSEIAPVPRSRYACPSVEGYYADPENCRWFFACLDHRRDGSELTAYEFRCPFGLVFDEKSLVCNWPWYVDGCGSGAGVASASSGFTAADILEGRLRPSFAHIPDHHVSGGRIENSAGGYVLGSSLVSGLRGIHGSGHYRGESSNIDSGHLGVHGNLASANIYTGVGSGLSKEEIDNSGAYIHDPTGDHGGDYIHQEGPQGPGSVYVADTGAGGGYVHRAGPNGPGGSGAYVHDSRGDHGGDYSHQEGPGSPYVAGVHGGAAFTDTTLGLKTTPVVGVSVGQTGADASGAYIHDTRGDHGEGYVHEEGAGSPYVAGINKGTVFTGTTVGLKSTPGIGVDVRGYHDGSYAHKTGPASVYVSGVSSGPSYVTGSAVGSQTTPGIGISLGSANIDTNGAYIHDSTGDHGGEYTHQNHGSGYAGDINNGLSYVGSTGGLKTTPSAGVLLGQTQVDDGAYVHDYTGDHGGDYVHQEGPGSVPFRQKGVAIGTSPGYIATGASGDYVHDTRGDHGGEYIHQNIGDAGYIHEQNKGSYIAGGLGTSGSYVHDSSGDHGVGYIHQGVKGGSYLQNGDNVIVNSGLAGSQGKGVGSAISYTSYTSGSGSGSKLHYNANLNQGQYVHDSTGDQGLPYVHEEGPQGPQGPGYVHVEGPQGPGYVHDNSGNYVAGLYSGNAVDQGHYAGHFDNYNTYNRLRGQSGLAATYTHDDRGQYLHDNSGGYVHDNSGNYVPHLYSSGTLTVGNQKHYAGGYGNYVKPTGSHLPSSYYSTSFVNSHGTYPTQYVSSFRPGAFEGIGGTAFSNTQPAVKISDNIGVVKAVSPHSIYSVSTPKPVSYHSSVNTPVSSLGSVAYVNQPTATVSPIVVSSTPAIPFNPVQYSTVTQKPLLAYNQVKSGVQSHSFVTPSVPVLSHSYKQPINTFTISGTPTAPVLPVTTPLPPVSKIAIYDDKVSHTVVPSSVSYIQEKVNPISIVKTPVVPLNPVQYVKQVSPITPVAPVVSTHYQPTIDTNQHISYVQQPVINTYQQPEVVRNNFYHTVSTPSPAVSTYTFGTKVEPARVGYNEQKVLQADYKFIKQPVAVSTTPSTPIEPVKFVHAIKPIVISTPAPFKTHSESISVANAPVAPISSVQYLKPAISTQLPPSLSYSYKSPSYVDNNLGVKQVVQKEGFGLSYQQPVIKTDYHLPVSVSTTPIVPLNPVQYVKPFELPVHKTESRYQPVSYVNTYEEREPIRVPYQQPIVETSYISQKPVVVTTPSPTIFQKTGHCANCVSPSLSIKSEKAEVVQPIVVSTTPVVPLAPVQYSKPISKIPSLSYTYQQPIQPVGSLEKQQIHISEYQSPSAEYLPPLPSANLPVAPVASYTYDRKIPVGTLEHQKNDVYSYSNKAYAGPSYLPPVASVVDTPVSPQVSYRHEQQYIKPAVKQTYETKLISPVAPIVSTPTPPVFSYSYEQQPAKPFESFRQSYESKVVVPPVAPIVSTTPAVPVYSYTEQQAPVIKSEYVNKAAVSSAYVPLNVDGDLLYGRPVPVKGCTICSLVPSNEERPVTHVNSYNRYEPGYNSFTYQQTPAKPVSYEFQPGTYVKTEKKPITPTYHVKQPIYKVPVTNNQYLEEKPCVSCYNSQSAAISVSSTPSVPLNPVRYVTTPTPVIKQTPTYAPIKVVQPVHSVVTDYQYQKPVLAVQEQTVVQQPVRPVVDYTFQKTFQKVRPVTVSTTPIVPLNRVQYITKTTPFISSTTPAPVPVTYTDSHYYEIKKVPSQPTVVPLVTNYPATTTVKPVSYEGYNRQQNVGYSSSRLSSPAPFRKQYQENYVYTSGVTQTPIDLGIVTGSPSPVFEEYFGINRNEVGSLGHVNIRPEGEVVVPTVTYKTPAPTLKPVTYNFETRVPVKQYTYQTTAIPSTISPDIKYSVTYKRPTTLINQPVSFDLTSNDADEPLNPQIDIAKINIDSREQYYVPTSTFTPSTVGVSLSPTVKRVKVNNGDGQTYYVRKQKVRVRPVVTTENYPPSFSTTYKPVVYSSTLDLSSPTLYTTTVRPVITSSVSSAELDIDTSDEEQKLVDEVSGNFGEVINVGSKGVIEQQSYSGLSSTTVASLKDGEAIVGVIKKTRVSSDGRKKAKVVVVSRLSDFNPILVGKLGAQCSCQNDGQEPTRRRVAVKRVKGRLFTPQTTTTGYSSSQGYESRSTSNSYLDSAEQGYEYQEPVVEIKPIRKVQRIYSTTSAPVDVSYAASIDSGYVTQVPSRGRNVGRKQTFKIQSSSEVNSIETETKVVTAGVPSGDTVDLVRGTIECQRAGLFRHPKHCNKFYSCNWDSWKKKFTLSVFNCPIHLAYDSNLGACNWPSKGPACSDDNLLV